MNAKPKFSVGQNLWFRYKKDRPAPVSILDYGDKPKTYNICSLEAVFILQNVEEEFLFATEEEAKK